jgi:hypothetical protein
MREIEVARRRVASRRCSAFALRGSSVVASLLMVALLGCGDATCPAGSQSVDGQCVPAKECDGGECMRESGVSGDGGTAVPDDQTKPPGKRNDAGGSAGASGAGGSPANDGGQDAGQSNDAAVQDDASSDAGQPDAEPVGPCVDYDCGAHGTCEVVADVPSCTCNSGFTGERCDRCMPGFGVGGDSCVPACEADDAPECGAQGACEVVEGAASCACVHPAVGTLCDQCAQNFKLTADGSCVPDCGDCGPHGYCDGSLMIPECACYAGYSWNAQTCVWIGDGTTGGIRDGALENAGSWDAHNTLFANGTATFRPVGDGVNCDVGALSQTFHMPTREQGEPLELLLETTTSCTDADPENCPPLLVELGSAVTRLRVAGAAGGKTGTQTICLGDEGYGDSVTLRIKPGVAKIDRYQYAPDFVGSLPQGFACDREWPVLRRIAIGTSGSCGFGGGLQNEDFASTASWTLANGAKIAGGLLTMPPTALASAQLLLNADAEISSPAIQITARSTATESRLEVKLDGLPISTLTVGGNDAERYVCLPDWARGAAHEVQLLASWGGAIIDTVAVANHEGCEAGTFDQGFERQFGTGSWFVHAFSTMGTVRLDPTAYSGANSASVNGEAPVAATMRVPDARSSAHAALGFVAQTSGSNVVGQLLFQSPSPALSATLALEDSLGWQPFTVCLGSIWDGQLLYALANIRANLTAGGGNPEVRIDQFGADISTRCPR